MRRPDTLDRRAFGVLSVAAAATLVLPPFAAAAAITESDLDIRTPDGLADAYLAHPATGRHAAVLMWTDNRGLSPTFRSMARRLAQSGYSVLVPNAYYRVKRTPVVPIGASGGAPGVRETLVSLMSGLTAATGATDARAFGGFLDSHPAVDTKRRMGTCAYSNLAQLALRTAGALPDRVGAVAVFHGDNLLTDAPDSPHRLVPQSKARYVFAITETDEQRQPGSTAALREVFADAKRAADIEVHPGTTNGWCMPDSAYYNPVQAERAWQRMLALFNETLA